jgi:hypothetical protein
VAGHFYALPRPCKIKDLNKKEVVFVLHQENTDQIVLTDIDSKWDDSKHFLLIFQNNLFQNKSITIGISFDFSTINKYIFK